MPAKKKGGTNGFYYFMMEFKDKNPRKYGNMQEVSTAAGQVWDRMSEEQKRPYVQRAKTTKNNQKVIKYTSFGQDIAVVQRQQNDILLKHQQMKDDIEKTIQLAVESGKLPDEVFYFIHINYFCYCNNDKRYYPAEIAVIKWSLKHGAILDNVYSVICKPGNLPLGYTAAAMEISKETHQIEPPLSSDAEYNLDQVAHGLLKFVSSTNSNSKAKLPPLYASNKNIEVVENVLFQFVDDFDNPEFKVYSLEYFFYALRNHCGEEKVWTASSLSQLELEKDKYEFCRQIACKYHETSEIPNYCSQSHVIRTVYTICDNCCADMNIDLIPGQHVPRQANLSAARAPSRASSVISSIENPRNQSSRHQLQSAYLSHAETDMSELSETSTMVDPNEYVAGGYFDTTYSQADAGEWSYPKQKKKGTNLSKTDSGVDNSASASNRPPKQPVRRPVTLSAGFSQMSISKESRGRGRGIAANFSNSAN